MYYVLRYHVTCNLEYYTRTTVTICQSNGYKSGKGMKVEKDEFLIDDGKSAMMTMRRRPLTDRSGSRLELRQLERHGCQQ